jgi:hypothetical protein
VGIREVMEGWIKLLNEELHNLYYLSSIIRVIKEDQMGGVCSMHKGDERCIQNFGQKT